MPFRVAYRRGGGAGWPSELAVGEVIRQWLPRRLPILAGLTQWVQSRMMLTKSSDPQQQMMNTMMNFMPLIVVFFATRYASGLSLYWVTSTLIGIAIQYRITGLGLLPFGPGRTFGSLGPGRTAT